MMASKLHIAVLLLGLLLFITSCSFLKKSDEHVVKGDYKITNVQKSSSGRTHIVCIVYGKLDHSPVPYAVVWVKELQKWGLTNTDGVWESNMPAGKFTITVINNGTEEIQTKRIRVKLGTKIEIKFELGGSFIY